MTIFGWQENDDLKDMDGAEAMIKWIDEGVYADEFDVHAYCCPLCGKHILETPGNEPRWCPACGEVVNKAKDGEQDGL